MTGDGSTWGELLGPPRRELRLARRELLFRRHEAAHAVYLLASGGVRLERPTADGDVVVLHRVRPGETFAEAALFADTYHCDAVVTAASRVLVFAKATVLARLAADPDRALDLVALLARRLRELRALLELRSLRSAEERVVGYLALDLPAPRPPTFAALAAEVGLSREAFSRAVGRLERRGRVRRDGRRLVLVAAVAEA